MNPQMTQMKIPKPMKTHQSPNWICDKTEMKLVVRWRKRTAICAALVWLVCFGGTALAQPDVVDRNPFSWSSQFSASVFPWTNINPSSSFTNTVCFSPIQGSNYVQQALNALAAHRNGRKRMLLMGLNFYPTPLVYTNSSGKSIIDFDIVVPPGSDGALFYGTNPVVQAANSSDDTNQESASSSDSSAEIIDATNEYLHPYCITNTLGAQTVWSNACPFPPNSVEWGFLCVTDDSATLYMAGDWISQPVISLNRADAKAAHYMVWYNSSWVGFAVDRPFLPNSNDGWRIKPGYGDLPAQTPSDWRNFKLVFELYR